MKINAIGPAVSPYNVIPLRCLAFGVLFSLPTCPFSLFIRLKDGEVYNFPSFNKVYGYECNLDGMVIPHPEATLTVQLGTYDSTNPKNNYYKSGTEPL